MKLCLICNSKHHTSICNKNRNALLTRNSTACTYLLVFLIEGIKFRASVDNVAGASYVSSTIISLITQKTKNKSEQSLSELKHLRAHP